MTIVSVDQSKNVKLIYRKGEGKPLTFQFLQDSNAYDISTLEFLFQVLDINTGETVFELTEEVSGGLTNSGVTGLLQVSPSDDNVDIEEKSYIYKLKVVSPTTRTWFNGLFVVNDSPLLEEETDNVNVDLDTGDITIEVSMTGVAMSGDEILASLTDTNIAELYNLLVPYISGEVQPGGPSDYIGTLYERLLPYITGES
jgi:hypothetical protein